MVKDKKTLRLIRNIIIMTIVVSLTFSSVALSSDTSNTNKITDDNTAIRLLNYLFPKGYDDYLIYYHGPINKGAIIRDKNEIVIKSPEKGFVYFYDNIPKANFEHDYNYAFVSMNSRKIVKQTSKDIPMNFKNYKIVNTKIGDALKSVRNVRAKIPENVIPCNYSFNGTRYAILISGGSQMESNHFRYWNDLSNIYIALNYVCGFSEENIITFCSDGLNPVYDQSIRLSVDMDPIYANSDPDLDGDGDQDINYSCTMENIETVFENLSNVLTTGDQLFIFVTDHGNMNNRVDGCSSIVLWESSEELTDEHLAELLDSLPQCEIICTFGQCFQVDS